MALHVRLARPADLAQAHALVATGSRGLYGADVLAELPRWWREVIHARRLELYVFEDDSQPAARRIRLVASGGFVPDTHADAIVAGFQPGLAHRVVASELAGTPVLLDRAGQAVANAGPGVNALGLDFACAEPDWSVLGLVRWAPLLIESLRGWLDGWKLRLAVREVVGRDLSLMARASGLPRLVAAPVPSRQATPAERRYLHGMSRQQAQRRPTSLQAVLFFRDHAPRFHFSPGEQDLLLLALRNRSDAACADELGLSPDTVKMRWRGIFERVAAHRPDWFPASAGADGSGADRTTRGVEKRRHLLAYLQRHPEELRPYQR
ncbi:MAG: hypothetical protein KA297_25840 [Kofleriaceae bacterium]|nr:hypothetical protein [Kofleriaceae bacterium]MBP6841127.1 hypothetical protein [Kofleriaceae bacterium]